MLKRVGARHASDDTLLAIDTEIGGSRADHEHPRGRSSDLGLAVGRTFGVFQHGGG